jgi:hypothetical protein
MNKLTCLLTTLDLLAFCECGGGGGDIGCCAKRCGQNDSENYPCTW